jgi:hypothetical protein
VRWKNGQLSGKSEWVMTRRSNWSSMQGSQHPLSEKELDRWFLDRLCPIPRPLETDTELRRSKHLDLGDLSDDELFAERRRCRNRLDYDPNPIQWLKDRLRLVHQEIGKRKSQHQSQGDKERFRKDFRSSRIPFRTKASSR